MATWTCQLMLGLAFFCFAAPLLVQNGASADSIPSPEISQLVRGFCAMKEAGEHPIADALTRALETKEGKESVMAIVKNMKNVKGGEHLIADVINRVRLFFQILGKVCELQEAAGKYPIAGAIYRALGTEEGREALMAIVRFFKNIREKQEAGEHPIADAIYHALKTEEGRETLMSINQFVKNIREKQEAGEHPIADAINHALDTVEGREALLAFCAKKEAGEHPIADALVRALETEKGKEAVMAIVKNMKNVKGGEHLIADVINRAKLFFQILGKVCELQEAAGKYPIAGAIYRALGTEEGREALMAIVRFFKNIREKQEAGEHPIADAICRALKTEEGRKTLMSINQFMKNIREKQEAGEHPIADAINHALDTAEGSPQ